MTGGRTSGTAAGCSGQRRQATRHARTFASGAFTSPFATSPGLATQSKGIRIILIIRIARILSPAWEAPCAVEYPEAVPINSGTLGAWGTASVHGIRIPRGMDPQHPYDP